MGAPDRSFVVEARARAPRERVFDLLADGAGWSSWAGPLVPRSAWAVLGDPPPDGPGAVRRLGVGVLSSREQVVEHDRPRQLGYRLLARFPVHGYHAVVDLAEDTGGTRIRWSATFERAAPGLTRVSRVLLRATVASLARHLVAASERP